MILDSIMLLMFVRVALSFCSFELSFNSPHVNQYYIYFLTFNAIFIKNIFQQNAKDIQNSPCKNKIQNKIQWIVYMFHDYPPFAL
jgi:hypothetical protein